MSRGGYPRAVEDAEARLARREARVRLVTRVLLAVGFAAAVIAYVVARQRPENPLGYDPLQTKQYRHDLEVYGGKANVIAAEFREWFASLWYGRNLAYTIAVLTVLVVLVFRFLATPAHPIEDEEPEGSPSGSG